MGWSKDKKTGKTNKQYPPKIKLHFPIYDGKMMFKAFVNSKENPITSVEQLEKELSGKADIVAIVRCDKVTFNGGKYGLKWRIEQLKIYTAANPLQKYSFIADSDDEAETETSRESSTQSVKAEAVNIVEDSE